MNTVTDRNLRFIVPESINANDLINEIADNFSIVKIRPATVKRQYRDTFDWRLYKQNLALYRQSGSYFLVDTTNGKIIAETKCPTRKHFKFWWDLPPGPLQDSLRQHMEMRALLPRAATFARTRPHRILNQDDKIIMQLQLERISLCSQPKKNLITILTLDPVRGYVKHLQDMQKFADSKGLMADSGNALQMVFSAAGHFPASYSTKLDIELQPEFPASLAAIKIFKSQLCIMKLNEAGILSDIDSEFLHDFRVALRRTRAALGQIKNVFAQQETIRFKKELDVIGKMTNRLRDLDVYLLKQEFYRFLLPEQLRPRLDHLFQILAKERRKELRIIQKKMNSREYRDIMTDWQNFLDSYAVGGNIDGKNAEKPIIELARRFIYKSHAKVINRGRKIKEDTQDKELHRLRIACKKMRYLMEFFSCLFPTEQMQHMIKQSKKLQENLGDYNDLFVQQGALQEYLDQLVAGSITALDIAAAIGGLLAKLSQKQQETRQAFFDTFKNFDQPENNQLFTELFHGQNNRADSQ